MTALDGRYVLDEVLGRGATATVYRALDVHEQRHVAVKLFDRGADPRRVDDEARLGRLLDHPHVVGVLDAGSAPDGRRYLVMPLVLGQTLEQRLRLWPMSTAGASVLGVQLAEGLAHAHARGIVHRDVTPANVLLNADGDAHLLDLGIAQDGACPDASATGTGQLVGSVPYLSPEQVRGEPATAASDVWALGLVLLEALGCGQALPGTTVESATPRLEHPPHVDPALPAPWPALLAAMTDLDPDARPSAALVAAVLRGDDHVDAPVPAPTGDRRRRKAGAAGAGLVAAAAAAVLVAAGGGPAVPAERNGSPGGGPASGGTRTAPATAAPAVDPGTAAVPAAGDAPGVPADHPDEQVVPAQTPRPSSTSSTSTSPTASPPPTTGAPRRAPGSPSPTIDATTPTAQPVPPTDGPEPMTAVPPPAEPVPVAPATTEPPAPA